MNNQQQPEEWRKGDSLHEGYVGLSIKEEDGTLTYDLPEWLVDAILRDHELAQKYRDGTPASQVLHAIAIEAEEDAATFRALVERLRQKIATKVITIGDSQPIARIVWNGDFDSISREDLEAILIPWLADAEAALAAHKAPA